VGRKRNKGFEMNLLVFVLIVITNVEGEEVKEEFGAWRRADMHKCIYFSRNLSTQNTRGGGGMDKWNKAFKIPLTAFCEPKYVDPKTTEVYP